MVFLSTAGALFPFFIKEKSIKIALVEFEQFTPRFSSENYKFLFSRKQTSDFSRALIFWIKFLLLVQVSFIFYHRRSLALFFID